MVTINYSEIPNSSAPAATVPLARESAPKPTKRAALRAVVAPPLALRAPVAERPLRAPPVGRPPLVWLLGCHGGAGTTTLARLIGPAAESGRWWPGPIGRESPYVLLVARETAIGLAAADALMRQHHTGLAGGSRLVGLVTVAARPGRMPAQIRRDRDLYAGLVPHMWRIGWREEWMLTGHSELPTWIPELPAPAKPTRGDPLAHPPPEVCEFGRELVAAITAIHHTNPEIGETS